MDKLCFQSLGSGSSGNCYFIGNKQYGILIDAGIGVRSVRKYLRNIGLDFANIHAIFVTHDHADHIRAVGSLGERYRIPVYATPETHEGISRSYCVTEKLFLSKKFINKNETIQIGDFKITAFHVSHDASDNVGYMIEYKEKRFTFATDLGHVCEQATEKLRGSNFMVFEANYDEFLLRNGSYPVHLQQRIMADTGHLSNEQCGKFLAENYHYDLSHVFLCHLSRENNRPEIAYETVKYHLGEKGIRVGTDLQVVVLDRYNPSILYEFE